jgi:Fe-S-cluster-containing dehydrogenase component
MKSKDGRGKAVDRMDDLLFFDPLKCVDCRICELTCTFVHRGGFNPRYSYIKISPSPKTGVDTLLLSKDCTLCYACEANCPTGALRFGSELEELFRDARGGTVVKRGFPSP